MEGWKVSVLTAPKIKQETHRQSNGTYSLREHSNFEREKKIL